MRSDAARILAALPQTQCTRCGYPDCAAYAQAIAAGLAAINQCPPGGAQGIARLAAITGMPVLPLNADNGSEAPRAVMWIDEAWCIGCTLCIKACPVDAIVGANKMMHTIIEADCTGCELCIPACPVDCILSDKASGEATGWDAWSSEQAMQARDRYAFARQRRGLDTGVTGADPSSPAGADDTDTAARAQACEPMQDSQSRRQRLIEAARAKARARRTG